MIIYTKGDSSVTIPCGLGQSVCDEASFYAEKDYVKIDKIEVHSINELLHHKAYATYFTYYTPDEHSTTFTAVVKAPIVSELPGDDESEGRDNSYFVLGCTGLSDNYGRFGIWMGHRGDLRISFGTLAVNSVYYTNEEIGFADNYVKITATNNGNGTYSVIVNDDPATLKTGPIDNLANLGEIHLFGRYSYLNDQTIHAAIGTGIAKASFYKVYDGELDSLEILPYAALTGTGPEIFKFIGIHTGECDSLSIYEPVIDHSGYVIGTGECYENS